MYVSTYLKSKFKKFGNGTRIDANVRVINPNVIEIGDYSNVEFGAQLIGGRHLIISNEVIIKSGCILKVGGFKESRIHIEEGTSINENCHLDGVGGIVIGKNVLIAPNCAIISSSHNFKDRKKEIHEQGRNLSTVKIMDDVWLGANSTINPGVTIGKGAVVGSGAVVTKDLPPYSVAVGVPAEVISYRE